MKHTDAPPKSPLARHRKPVCGPKKEDRVTCCAHLLAGNSAEGDAAAGRPCTHKVPTSDRHGNVDRRRAWWLADKLIQVIMVIGLNAAPGVPLPSGAEIGALPHLRS